MQSANAPSVEVEERIIEYNILFILLHRYEVFGYILIKLY